jgi:hypothetical protein
MANAFEGVKTTAAKLETPFTIRQVETHLVFGPLSRHLPFAYLILVSGIITLVWTLFHRSAPLGQHVSDITGILIFQIVLLPLVLFRMTRRQQAIVGWGSIKFGLGFAAFMMMTIGGFGGLAQGHRDALPDLFLGLIWIPGVEFIPKIAPHQKYVTIARVLLSIPCVYFGVNSDEWHWD